MSQKSIPGYTNELFEEFLSIYWLRPENTVWDTVASSLLRKELKPNQRRLELGCGNGMSTFVASGGRFKKSYDWYRNVNTKGFSKNKDIYDHNSLKNIRDYVLKKPKYTWDYAIDLKKNLVSQAQQLGVFKEAGVLNLDTEYQKLSGEYDLIFSNVFYWLENYIEVMRKAEQLLSKNGRLIVVFPNNHFKEYCQSYDQSNGFYTLLNRGRANCVQWYKSCDTFMAELTKAKVPLELVSHQTYLSKELLTYWDFGMRPFSPFLIDHFNGLTPKAREQAKAKWMSTVYDLFWEFTQMEMRGLNSTAQGGYSFCIFKKG